MKPIRTNHGPRTPTNYPVTSPTASVMIGFINTGQRRGENRKASRRYVHWREPPTRGFTSRASPRFMSFQAMI